MSINVNVPMCRGFFVFGCMSMENMFLVFLRPYTIPYQGIPGKCVEQNEMLAILQQKRHFNQNIYLSIDVHLYAKPEVIQSKRIYVHLYSKPKVTQSTHVYL